MKHSSFCGAPDIPLAATLPREVPANVFSFNILTELSSEVLKSDNCCYEICLEMFYKISGASSGVEAALTDCTAITTSAESLSSYIWLGNSLTKPPLLYFRIYRPVSIFQSFYI